jgi:hypothetical protein
MKLIRNYVAPHMLQYLTEEEVEAVRTIMMKRVGIMRLMLLLFDNIWEVYKSTHETHKVRNIELN